jgi:hypothetical protein
MPDKEMIKEEVMQKMKKISRNFKQSEVCHFIHASLFRIIPRTGNFLN